MAHAKNMGHRLGIAEGADILVNLDADNFTDWDDLLDATMRSGILFRNQPRMDFARYIAEQFRAHDGIFLFAKMVKDGPGRTPRGINGRIVVTSKAFLNAGGYDEQFHTWSPDDKDFHLRLRRLGYAPKEIPGLYLDAILHNDRMRFKEYQHVSNRDGEYSDQEGLNDADTTIANFGRIGLGMVRRNFSPQAIWLGPLPTRIFGIGMHKTATTSLHAALTVLGYESAHWESAHWAKQIWEEMTTWGRSRTLERSYALCDLPIPMLFRQLDKAYPGSKFILTKRDEARWIESVRNHWSPEHNHYRAGWDTDPFTHRIHHEVYGRKTFDAEIFLNRYRKHNAEVDAYFENRPHDLLVMEMDQNPGWKPLCEFLGRPVPEVEYPRKFATVRGYVLGNGEGI